AGQRLEGSDEVEVVSQILALESGEAGPRSRGLRRALAEQASRKHAIGRDADAKLAHEWQDRAFDPAADERILDLQICDGADRVRSSDRVRADFREPNIP